jgi:hypothetical protein
VIKSRTSAPFFAEPPANDLERQSNNLSQQSPVPAIVRKFDADWRAFDLCPLNPRRIAASTKVALTKPPITVGNDLSEWYSAAWIVMPRLRLVHWR